MKVVYCFVIVLLLLSCKKNEINNLNEDEKMLIIAQAFSDSTNNIDLKKCFLDTRYVANSKFYYYGDKISDSIYEFKNQIEYLSFLLKENDTSFLKEQIENEEKMKLSELSKYGFKILNPENEINDSICKIILSKPLFNKTQDEFYILLKENEEQSEFIFHKVDKKWKLNKRW